MTIEPGSGEATAAAPPVDECDMIMKGGITSGVVYPRAACRLAARYRFRRLGGASAGAIAAACVAAAEHGREKDGFTKLGALPDELGSTMSTLFQPSPSTAPAYNILSAWLEPQWGTARKVGATIGVLVRRAPVAFVVALVVVDVVVIAAARLAHTAPGGGEWATALRLAAMFTPVALVVALLASAVSLARRTLAALPANGYGLCDGHTSTGVGVPLTDWLSSVVDDLACVPTEAGPLTFGDLWGADAVALHRALGDEPSDEAKRAAHDARLIDLEVMTTNLTFRRPYRFPFDQRVFMFCGERMRRYLPDDVVAHMEQHSAVAEDKLDGRRVVSMVCPCHGNRLRELPDVPDLPVVLAARISLSFPGLISALPLFAVDWSRGPGERTVIETWFSDGGISSNFPMHLFDAYWPRRPTFGFNLQPPHPDFRDQLVWRPTAGAAGIVPRSHAIRSMTQFLAAILDTMQNWADSTLITLPGFRDRVAEIRHTDDEGGINLKMAPTTITAMADRGAEAAALFDTFDFDVHCWIRYRLSMSELDGLLDHLAERYPGPDGYEAFLARFAPDTTRYPVGSVAADTAATQALMALAEEWEAAGHPANKGRVPKPKPAMRLVPRQ